VHYEGLSDVLPLLCQGDWLSRLTCIAGTTGTEGQMHLLLRHGRVPERCAPP
jgi:hypothetical protein